MEQIKFIFSLIFIILGICIITVSKIAEEIVPKSGFYDVHLTLNYWIGVLCIIGGIIHIIKNSKITDHYLSKVDARNKEFEEENNHL